MSLISLIISIEKAKSELDMILANMNTGETIALVGTKGLPVAVLVSIQPETQNKKSGYELHVQKDNAFFPDNEMFEGDAPPDASECLGSYLYDEREI